MERGRVGFRYISISSVVLMMTVISLIMLKMPFSIVNAEEESTGPVYELCDEYTADIKLQDGSGNDITQYEAYIDERTEAEIV